MHNVYVRSNKLFALFKRLDGFWAGRREYNFTRFIRGPTPTPGMYSSKKFINHLNISINNHECKYSANSIF